MDRAGIVEDGPTHAGIFDLSHLRCVPNMIVMTPSTRTRRGRCCIRAVHEGPAAIRYPRGRGPGVVIEQNMTAMPIGKARIVREGSEVVFLAFGSLVPPALVAGDTLGATVVDMRFVKPLMKIVSSHRPHAMRSW